MRKGTTRLLVRAKNEMPRVATLTRQQAKVSLQVDSVWRRDNQAMDFGSQRQYWRYSQCKNYLSKGDWLDEIEWT
jgi:hypothetical protein